jgi:pimeloyl-ACP methyl ester carboxylesterase/DNA-binding CsgD family transcriptional regulator
MEARYARSGDVRIAYQVVGQGQIDLVLVPEFMSNLEVQWEDAGYSRLLNRLSAFSRLILFDKRGSGLTDRVDANRLPTLEERIEDLRAVMDAVGSRRAALLGASDGVPMAIQFAATYPERTRALILYGGYAHFQSSVMGREALSDFIRTVEAGWGSGVSLSYFAPGLVGDNRFRKWWARFERLCGSPTAAAALARMSAQADVRPLLDRIRIPTLVIHRTDDARVKISGGRYLAEHIRGARLVELPGRDHPIWLGGTERIVDEIEEFLTGARPAPRQERVLAAILIARLVAPERMAARLGDRTWSERMDRLRATAAAAIARHGGHLVATGPEEIGARFDGPAYAVRCAVELRDAATELKLDLAAGVHVGEIETNGSSVAGLALHVTGRLSAQAKTGEVLVSGLVRDLAAGSGLHFVEHGGGPIEGLPAGMRLLAVMVEQHLEPAAKVAKAASLDALSTREREVLALVADGLSNAAIADQLRLSDHTVKRHVANILLKLDLPSRAAAAALAGRQRSA